MRKVSKSLQFNGGIDVLPDVLCMQIIGKTQLLSAQNVDSDNTSAGK